MNARKIKLFDLKTDKENFFIKVAVRYDKGGISFWDYKRYPEGIYLHVQPVERKASHGMICESYGMGTGASHFVEAGARFSAKRLNTVAAEIKANKGEKMPEFSAIIRKICERDGFTFDTLDFGA